jgi:hypothetical protein
MRGRRTQPQAGNISLCRWCGYVAVFTGEGLNKREPDAKEAAAIAISPVVAMAKRKVASQWN